MEVKSKQPVENKVDIDVNLHNASHALAHSYKAHVASQGQSNTPVTKAPQARVVAPNMRNPLGIIKQFHSTKSKFGDGDIFATHEGLSVYKTLMSYQEPIILADPRSPIHQEHMKKLFHNQYIAKYSSKMNRKKNLMNSVPQMNLGIVPDTTMVSRGVVNALTPGVDVHTDLDDFYMTFIGGKPGTGKSVFLNQLMTNVRDMMRIAIMKGKNARPEDFLGLLLSDPKNELQENAIRIFHGLKVRNDRGEEVDLLRIISPVEVQIEVPIDQEDGSVVTITKIIRPTNVDLVGSLPINICNERMWSFLNALAGEGGSKDPFWSNSGEQMFNAFGIMSHYCLKALNIPRTTWRLYGESMNADFLFARLKEAHDAIAKKSNLEQTLFFYDLLECYEVRSKEMAAKNNYTYSHDYVNARMELNELRNELRPKVKLEIEKVLRDNKLKAERLANPAYKAAMLKTGEMTEQDIEEVIFFSEMSPHDIKIMIDERVEEIIQENQTALYDLNAKVKKCLERYQEAAANDEDIKKMFDEQQLQTVYAMAKNNSAAVNKEIMYFRDQYNTMTDQLKSNIFMTLMATLKPLMSNPAVMPWLTCEDGVTGADACSGQFLALYINRDEQPLFYDFATKMVKSQLYDALRKRTATWKDSQANRNKGIDPFQTRVVEIADEEYLSIGDGKLEMSIMSILRSLGLSRWVATQFKEQYDERMGGGSNLNTATAANYVGMFNNVVLFKTSNDTYEFFSKLWGTHPQNYMCVSNDEVASGINKMALRNVRELGMGNVYNNFIERNITTERDKDSAGSVYTYEKEKEREVNVLPTGAMNIIDAPLFQIGKGEKESLMDMTGFLNRPFACMAQIRQGGVEQYGVCLLTPYFAAAARDEERLRLTQGLQIAG